MSGQRYVTVADLQATIKHLRNQCEVKDREIMQLRTGKFKEIEDLKDQVKDKDTAGLFFKNVNEELQTAERRIKEFEELMAKEHFADKTREHLEETLKKTIERMKEIQGKWDSADQENKDLLRKINEKDGLVTKLEEATAKLDELESKLKEAAVRRDALEEELNQKKEVEAELSDAQYRLQQLERELNNANKKLQDLDARLNLYRKRPRDLTRIYFNPGSGARVVKDRSGKNIKTIYVEDQRAAESDTARVRELESKCTKLQIENERLKSQITGLKNDLADLSSELRKANNNTRNQEQKKKQLERQVERLNEELSKMKGTLYKMDNRLGNLRRISRGQPSSRF